MSTENDAVPQRKCARLRTLASWPKEERRRVGEEMTRQHQAGECESCQKNPEESKMSKEISEHLRAEIYKISRGESKIQPSARPREGHSYYSYNIGILPLLRSIKDRDSLEGMIAMLERDLKNGILNNYYLEVPNPSTTKTQSE